MPSTRCNPMPAALLWRKKYFFPQFINSFQRILHTISPSYSQLAVELVPLTLDDGHRLPIMSTLQHALIALCAKTTQSSQILALDALLGGENNRDAVFQLFQQNAIEEKTPRFWYYATGTSLSKMRRSVRKIRVGDRC